MSLSELHGTLLHQLGIDHEVLAYRQAGREETLTDAQVTGAQVIHVMLLTPRLFQTHGSTPLSSARATKTDDHWGRPRLNIN